MEENCAGRPRPAATSCHHELGEQGVVVSPVIERMSSLDAMFLAIEDPRNPMNIGSVGIFEGPMPPVSEVFALVGQRVAAVTRCRQRVREPRGPLGRPVWVDDAKFDLDNHVRHVRLTTPEAGQLDTLVAQLMTVPLDRDRALWQIWVVDGLPQDQWAIIAMAHHCVVDGIAGSDLLSAILTYRADADGATPSGPTPPAAAPLAATPSIVHVLWFGMSSTMRSAATRLRGALDVLAHPRRSCIRARNIVVAARRLWLQPHHQVTSLVGTIGTTRTWTHLAMPMEQVTVIKASIDCTINDVVLTAVAGGFRDLLRERGEPVDGRTITAMVPVSLRSTTEKVGAGNRIANVHAPLPIGVIDPKAALQTVHATLDDLKGSHEIEATGLLLRIGDYVPRFVADRVSRTVLRRQRDVETVITNVPGPREPLHLGPHRMVEGYPVAPIGGRVRITVAVWSYSGHLAVGITGDADSVPDIDVLRRGISRGFRALVDATSLTGDAGSRALGN